MFNLNLDYFLFALGSCIGVIQIAAAASGLHGLLFIKGRKASHALGFGLLSVAAAWFAAVGDPWLAGDASGLEGSSQFGLFLGAAAAATAITALLLSALRRIAGGNAPQTLSLDALRHATPWELLRARVAKQKSHAGR